MQLCATAYFVGYQISPNTGWNAPFALSPCCDGCDGCGAWITTPELLTNDGFVSSKDPS